MKRFHIVKPTDDARIYVLSTSYVSPMSKLPPIEHELKLMKYIGEVIFDLVLSNGFTSNRYISLQFDGVKFDSLSAKITQIQNDNIRYELSLFYRENPQIVDASILHEPQKQKLYQESERADKL